MKQTPMPTYPSIIGISMIEQMSSQAAGYESYYKQGQTGHIINITRKDTYVSIDYTE